MICNTKKRLVIRVHFLMQTFEMLFTKSECFSISTRSSILILTWKRIESKEILLLKLGNNL